MEILKFIFHNFWTFIGTILLLGVILNGSFKFIIRLVYGYKPRKYSDNDLIAIYKMGRLDKYNHTFLDDTGILSEIKVFLKKSTNGGKTTSSK